jgi:benzaldehyde dehydrogenase (NAD)
LGRVGAATPDDLARAVERVTQAQRSCAALPYIERAQVLRRAARAFEENQAEIADWIVRESGALRPCAEFQ